MGLPFPREQLAEPMLRDIGDAGEDVAKPRLGVDVVIGRKKDCFAWTAAMATSAKLLRSASVCFRLILV